MMKFIKNLFKPKNNKVVNKNYKKVPEPNESEPKANWIAKAEDVDGMENKYKADELVNNITFLCHGGLRPNQDNCPDLIIYNYKKLLALGADEELIWITNILGLYLSVEQQQDFMNKVSQFKEYKEWKVNKRIKEIEEDFK